MVYVKIDSGWHVKAGGPLALQHGVASRGCTEYPISKYHGLARDVHSCALIDLTLPAVTEPIRILFSTAHSRQT